MTLLVSPELDPIQQSKEQAVCRVWSVSVHLTDRFVAREQAKSRRTSFQLTSQGVLARTWDTCDEEGVPRRWGSVSTGHLSLLFPRLAGRRDDRTQVRQKALSVTGSPPEPVVRDSGG